ncbi:unnamed protein product [Sphagnum jensenii]|uniref:Uncharacterized protein n=1 Tax=Sphagnum jensenii TaxID=128206 RepID=A0ABP0WFV2_9BRYO
MSARDPRGMTGRTWRKSPDMTKTMLLKGSFLFKDLRSSAIGIFRYEWAVCPPESRSAAMPEEATTSAISPHERTAFKIKFSV